jgi:hypothetical protein
MAVDDITNIPAPRVPLIDDRTGLMAREWYRFFLNLFKLTGSGTNFTSLEDLQVGPPTADPVDLVTDVSPNVESVVASLLQDALLAPPPLEVQHLHYGAFHDSTTQTAAAINTAYAVTLGSTDLSDGVERGSPTSRVICYNRGIYNFQFSMQMTKVGGAVTRFAYIWARINGTDVADSATRIAFSGNNNDLVAAWNFVLRMQSGDYFELMWSVEDTNIQIINVATVAPAPAIPSVILTVTEATI